LLDTLAVKLPSDVGRVLKLTVSFDSVAAVTVPTAPRLKNTKLLAATGLKPVPVMSRVVFTDCLRKVAEASTVTARFSALKNAGDELVFVERPVRAVKYPPA
jgi:hypothetical protein